MGILTWGLKPDVVAIPSVKLSHYFRKVGGYTPPKDHPHGWTVSQWRKGPEESVRLDDLIATNRRSKLTEHRIRSYLDKPGHGSTTPVCVVHQNGRWWLLEGHHRVVAAKLRGETYIRARVMRG